MALDLSLDPAVLTAALVDIPSVSRQEAVLADLIEQALMSLHRYDMCRVGNSVLARTNLGRPERVVLAGHLDTVPVAGNLPSHTDGDLLYGCGACDMKGGLAMLAHLAATVTDPAKDLTFVFYECEEIDFDANGLTRIAAEHPDWLRADLALLGEPTDGRVEAGCQGTMRLEVTLTGRRAHTARSWVGHNAIHDAGQVLAAATAFPTRTVDIDGLVYREGLNAVAITGGVANNVVPDRCTVRLNYRFAPDRSVAEAEQIIRAAFGTWQVDILEAAAGALPGLKAPAAAEFITAAGGDVHAKLGWTDVSRFAALGIPAVNFGPGDPLLAHTPNEHTSVRQIRQMTELLRSYLGRFVM